MVNVRYFAAAAEAAGREEEELEASTVAQLKALLVEKYGDAMRKVLASGSFLIDGVASRDDAATIGARIDVLPPFAGG